MRNSVARFLKKAVKPSSFKQFSTTQLNQNESGQVIKNSQYYMDIEYKHGCHNYKPIPVVAKEAKGIYITDVEGKQYMDFLSAYSAVNQGHCHPKIIQALTEQASVVTLTSRAFYNNKLGVLEEYITKLFDYDKVLMMNTGVEAGESGIKIARRWGYESKGVAPNKAKVLFANGNFWGRTLAACASSDDVSRYHNFGPFDLNFELIDYDDLSALETALKSDPNIVCYMVEPIQGERGVMVPTPGYLKKAHELCKQYNVLLMCDEVQTGLGRTGKLICSYWDDVKPDILLLGKALSGGVYPVSAVLCNNDIMDYIKPGDHGSTYGGNPLACAVAMTAVQTLIEEGMIENSLKLGEILRQELINVNHKDVLEVRGRGLFVGLEFKPDTVPTYEFCTEMKKRGLLAKQTHDTVVRFAPPLVINEQQLREGIEIIKESLALF